jgi:hypothetical protein
LTGVKLSIVPLVTADKSDNKCINTTEKVDTSVVSNKICTPMATSSQSVCTYTAAPNNIHGQSSKGAPEALSNMFSQGTVLNNCTFNINFNVELSNAEGQRHRPNLMYEPPEKHLSE